VLAAFSNGFAEPGGGACRLREGPQERHPPPGRAADEDRANDCERLAPSLRRHADVRKGKRRVISGDRRRCGKQQRDRSADEWRSGHGEGELSGAERDGAGDDPDDDRADVERGEACREAREKGRMAER
jgi:hypothetical protein